MFRYRAGSRCFSVYFGVVFGVWLPTGLGNALESAAKILGA